METDVRELLTRWYQLRQLLSDTDILLDTDDQTDVTEADKGYLEEIEALKVHLGDFIFNLGEIPGLKIGNDYVVIVERSNSYHFDIRIANFELLEMVEVQ